MSTWWVCACGGVNVLRSRSLTNGAQNCPVCFQLGQRKHGSICIDHPLFEDIFNSATRDTNRLISPRRYRLNEEREKKNKQKKNTRNKDSRWWTFQNAHYQLWQRYQRGYSIWEGKTQQNISMCRTGFSVATTFRPVSETNTVLAFYSAHSKVMWQKHTRARNIFYVVSRVLQFSFLSCCWFEKLLYVWFLEPKCKTSICSCFRK